MPNSPTPYCRKRELNDGYPLKFIWQQEKKALQNKPRLTHFVQHLVPNSQPDLLDHLPTFLCHTYASDFCVADDGFHTGRVAATTKGQETCWEHWAAYVAPVGVDPYLQDTPFMMQVCLLTGFAGQVRTVYYGRGQQIQAGSVSSTITSVGQMIPLATNTNPTKIAGSEKLLPCLQQMLDGFRKADPPMTKQLPVEADVPEFLVNLGLSPEACKLDCSIGDLTMIAFYYLFCASANTLQKGCGIIQNRLRNSSLGTSLSLLKTNKVTFAVCLEMPPWNKSNLQMAPP